MNYYYYHLKEHMILQIVFEYADLVLDKHVEHQRETWKHKFLLLNNFVETKTSMISEESCDTEDWSSGC